MDTGDDLLLDMIEAMTLDVLVRLGSNPDARYAFVKRFVALAQEVVGGLPANEQARPRRSGLTEH